MANFAILFPDIPFRSNFYVQEGTGATNIIAGSRNAILEESSVGSTTIQQFDLGEGVTDIPDAIAIARADMTVNQDTSDILISVFGSANDFVGEEGEQFLVGVDELMGPNSEDWASDIDPLSFSTPYRFWKFSITTTGGIAQAYSKVYLSEKFDFGGKDPIFEEISEFSTEKPGSRKQARKIRLTYVGVTKANKEDFVEKIYKHKDENPVFLWDSGNCVLDGEQLIYGSIMNAAFAIDVNEQYAIEIEIMEQI